MHDWVKARLERIGTDSTLTQEQWTSLRQDFEDKCNSDLRYRLASLDLSRNQKELVSGERHHDPSILYQMESIIHQLLGSQETGGVRSGPVHK